MCTQVIFFPLCTRERLRVNVTIPVAACLVLLLFLWLTLSVSVQSGPRLYSSCFSLQYLHCLLSRCLCAPTFCALAPSSSPPPAISCLPVSAVCVSHFSHSPLCLSCSCCLSLCSFSLFFLPPPFPIFFSVSDCVLGSGKRNSLLLSVQKWRKSWRWFLCIFDLSLFPVAHVYSSWANEQHKITTKESSMRE